MSLLVSVLRFIVGFLSFLIIFASVAFGFFMVSQGDVLGGIIVGIGGLLTSSVLFGVIALLFQICDHLVALRKYAEGIYLGRLKAETGERIEPSLRKASS